MDYKFSKLLTKNNFKTVKGEKLGYTTYILYMSPFTDNSKGINLCSHASAGCAASCLFKSGFGGMYERVQAGRRNKTEWFLGNRNEFMNALVGEITNIVRLHSKDGANKFAIRLNGTSDIRWEKIKIQGKNVFELFPEVQFYDYTKNHIRLRDVLPSNYHLTFSRSETNGDKVMEVLKAGFNVAMVFDKLPESYMGYPVIVGDETDLRFLDKKNVIVGLTYKVNTGKGGAERNSFSRTSGFVISTK